MIILNWLVIPFSLSVWAQFEPKLHSPDVPQAQSCDKACYDAYRYLMDDFNDDNDWVYGSASHQYGADNICASELCTGCPLCSFSHLKHEALANDKANLEARRGASLDTTVSCMDCQNHVDICRRLHDSQLDETPHMRTRDSQDPSCYPPSRTPNHEADFSCELDVCVNGPLHCHARGKCERRICKDLVARTNHIPPGLAPPCKYCFKPWIECIHSVCLPPTLDCLATNCTSPESAPNPACVKWCWSKSPIHCHRNRSCAHPQYAPHTRVNFQSNPMCPAGDYPLMDLSRECNQFRDACLETCDLQQLHSKCEEECEKKCASATIRQLCKDKCEERTCYEECRIKTCCIGPQQCQRGGLVFRCEGVVGLDCGKWAGDVA